MVVPGGVYVIISHFSLNYSQHNFPLNTDENVLSRGRPYVLNFMK